MSADRFDLAAAFAAADEGDVLVAQLFPLNDIGPLRVWYNWMYSALICTPVDTSDFYWVLSKTGSGATVSLSPQHSFQGGKTVYASVRPDYNQSVSVQVPFSGSWITAVGAGERMTLTEMGLLTIALQGPDGSYVSAMASQTRNDHRTAYRFQSNAASPGKGARFFVAVTQDLQSLGVPLAGTLGYATLESALAAQGATDPRQLAQRIVSTS